MKFDLTINLGNVISIGVMIVTLYGFHVSNVKRYFELEFKVKQMWHVFQRRFDISENPFEDDEPTKYRR